MDFATALWLSERLFWLSPGERGRSRRAAANALSLKDFLMDAFCRLAGCLALAAVWLSGAARGDWPQWGGPARDFSVAPVRLADAWPAEGPRERWRRTLGPGHSAILVEGDRLYTMLRRGEQDVIVALQAADGATVWEAAYDAPPKPGMQLDFGPGPHSTPLIADDAVVTLSGTALLNAFDKQTGKLRWSHDLMGEFGASHLGRGYGASPLRHQDLVIVNAGGQSSGVMAFRISDGQMVWQTPALRTGHSSPILATIAGVTQVIVAAGTERIGLAAADGAILWRVQADQQFNGCISTPVFLPPDRVLFSAAYGGGSHLIAIRKTADGFAAQEAWHHRKLKAHHGNLARVGEMLVASSGDFGPALLMGMRWADGEVLWRKRGLAKANLLSADGKLILLDEQGYLVLARANAEGFEELARCKPLEEKAWTAPTLVGATLYLRDNSHICALDLSPAGSASGG